VISYRSWGGRLQGGVGLKRLGSCIYKSFIGLDTFSCLVLRIAIRKNNGSFKKKRKIFRKTERFLENDCLRLTAAGIGSPINTKDVFARAEIILRVFDRGFLESVSMLLFLDEKNLWFF
jgi:hypothetical protein